MENLDQIKNSISEMEIQLDALKTQLESVKEKSDDAYSFIQDEMIQFVKKLHDEFEAALKRGAYNADFGDAIDLNLYDREIEVSVDSERITDTVIDEMDFSDSDDAILDTIADIVKVIKG